MGLALHCFRGAPVLQSLLLLLLANVEVVFQNLNYSTNQHVLERKTVVHEVLILAVGAVFHDPFHARLIVPAPIEQSHSCAAGGCDT